MSWRIKRSCLLVTVAVSLLPQPAVASPPEESEAQAPAVQPDFDALVREAQTIIDAVVEHHIDPPTRQEMWLAGAKALLAKVGVTHRPGLSAEISQLTTPGQFAEFANRLWSEVAAASRELPGPALERIFIDGVLTAVPGKAVLIPQKEFTVQEQFQGNRYIGTGIALSYDQEKKYPRIANVFPGGPMERAGGRLGDLILAIDDRDAHGLTVVNTVDLLRGEEGTEIQLVVGAGGEKPRTITVTRGHVVLETLQGLRKADDDRHWDYRLDADSSIRCVKVLQINGSTVHDLRRLAQRFQQERAQAVILDLRPADGVDLHYAVLLADALLDGGLIGRERTQEGVREFRADRDCLFRELPVALLVDSTTSGGAEWVAAAVQDNRAGIVVGEATAGNWEVLSTIPLPRMNAALSMKTGIFERPIVAPIQKSRDRDRRMFRGEAAADMAGGVSPDRRIAPRDREPSTGPFAVLRKPVPAGPAPNGSNADDPILKLAVKVLNAKTNGAQTDGD